MKEIKFPGSNLNFSVNPVAVSIFGLSIYWYALIMVSAFIVGILIFKKRDGLYDIKFNTLIDLLIYLIPISIVTARIYYVIFNLQYYLSNPMQICNLRTGGLAIYGGIIGGTITTIIFCKRKKIDLLNLLDYIVPALAIRTVNWKMG